MVHSWLYATLHFYFLTHTIVEVVVHSIYTRLANKTTVDTLEKRVAVERKETHGGVRGSEVI